ncbi:hypothetical protein GOODEAATRI_001734 [Goodea atripinnis]|uniref:Uncharacterized protein n=1 Tax=Goodea atripinnis TaxID=208336 RepID=A0ABV0N732_9TELE
MLTHLSTSVSALNKVNVILNLCVMSNRCCQYLLAQRFARQYSSSLLFQDVNSLSRALRGSSGEHARQPAVPSWLQFSSAGPLRLHHFGDHKRSLECGGPS